MTSQSTNEHVANIFEEIATLLDSQGNSPCRARRWSDSTEMSRRRDLFADLPGIGDELAHRIHEELGMETHWRTFWHANRTEIGHGDKG